MPKFSCPSLLRLAAAAGVLLFAACSPKLDWREVHGANAPFVILMPAKPVTASRPIDLDGMPVTMSMTAAEVDGVSFALGTAELPDASKAQAALIAMKTAMVKNISGVVMHEKLLDPAGSQPATIELETRGTPGPDGAGEPRLLVARFAAKDKRVYQAVVLGHEKKVSREAVDTFLTSFKLN